MIRQEGDNVPTQASEPVAPRSTADSAAGSASGPAAGSAGSAAWMDPAASMWWDATTELPLPWEARATVRQRRPAGLRLPAPDDPPPATGRMLGVCAWAALLGVVGLAVAGRALVALLTGGAPDWYEPTVLAGGVAGIGLTATAFLAVHHRRLPWVLLATATVPLVVNLASTAVAL
jgi:hypothetical protein